MSSIVFSSPSSITHLFKQLPKAINCKCDKYNYEYNSNRNPKWGCYPPPRPSNNLAKLKDEKYKEKQKSRSTKFDTYISFVIHLVTSMILCKKFIRYRLKRSLSVYVTEYKTFAFLSIYHRLICCNSK